MLNHIKNALKKLPPIQKIIAARDTLNIQAGILRDEVATITKERDGLRHEQDMLQAEFAALKNAYGFVPPGHFYSPIPSLDEVRRDKERIFGNRSNEIPGIDFHEQEQLQLLDEFLRYYQEMPFQDEKIETLRYYFLNPAYSYSDAICLHCMIRHLRPQRIIEVGSGFSSCMTLDTNDRFFGGAIECSFIEPYPELLLSLAGEKTPRIISSRLQDVDIAEFKTLQARDILFIDSTHVSKVGSDVNRIFFEILPVLASGVHIHFHDIFFPFEYPKPWIYEGRSWTELYLLRAFLQYNSAFRVVYMNTFMQTFHRSFFEQKMPLCLKNTGGSIWLRKE